MVDRKTNYRTATVLCILLAVVIFAIYGQVRTFQFVTWDDGDFVYENQQVTDGLTRENFLWSWQIHGPAHWHPLTWWSHQLNYQIFALDSGTHHLVNVVLHVAAALALGLAFWRLTEELWPSALVAALFAVHPLSVEPVAWVSHLRDPLSTLFWALVMLSYAAYARRGGAWRYLLVLLLFTLGLMAKPMLITLPCVLLLLDYWPLHRVQLGGWTLIQGEVQPHSEIRTRAIPWLLLEKVPLFVLAGISSWLSYLCQQGIGSISPLTAHPMGPRLANAAQSYVLHLRNMLWPLQLSVIYPFPESFHTPLVAGAVVLLLALTAAAIYWGRSRGYLLVGWLWYLGTLVPVIGILKMGSHRSMTDHHAYVPLLGIYVALAWTLQSLVQRREALRPVVLGGVAVVLLGLLPLTWRQVAVWRDSESLYRHALAVTSSNWLAHNNLGNVLRRQGKSAKAIEHYRQALRINSDYAKAHYNLGVALQSQGKSAKAIEQFRQALRIKPDWADAHNNLGVHLAEQGKLTEAIEHHRQALRIEPDWADAHYNLGVALQGQGKIAAAIDQYHRALRNKPDYATAHNNLGNALRGQGKIAAAIDHYNRALQIKPDYAEAHYNLGITLAPQRKLTEAIEHFQQALRKKPDYLQAHYSLGLTFQRQGKIEAAVRHYQRALDLNENYPLALNRLARIRATHPNAELRDGLQAVELAERCCALTGHQVVDVLDTLAAAYAESGNFERAQRWQEKALQIAPATQRAVLAARLKLYQQGQPYRESS